MTSITTATATTDTTSPPVSDINQYGPDTTFRNESTDTMNHGASPTTKIPNEKNNDALKEFMVLSPVKIFDYNSPSRYLASASPRTTTNSNIGRTDSRLSTENPVSPTQTKKYEDKFTDITTQLSNLLESLSEIYQKIGYSRSETHIREKTIFRGLSSCLRKFHTEATAEMEELATNNEIDEDILNKILNILGDPSGLETVPDLFVRNAIVIPKYKTVPQSPKKPLTLLSKKNLLDTAKRYVYERYCPKLVGLLKRAERLQRLVACVDGFQIPSKEDDEQLGCIVSKIPSLADASNLLKEIKEQLGQTQDNLDDTDRVTKFIRDRKDLLLHRAEFQLLHDEGISKIDRCAELYRVEYESRLNKVKEVTTKLRGLTTDLGVRLEDEMDEENSKFLAFIESSLTQQINRDSDTPLKIGKSRLETLDKILEHYTRLHRTRTEQIGQLWQQCSSLWNTLDVTEMFRQQFMADNMGFTKKVLSNLENELKRLEALKKERIKELIKTRWAKVNELWATMQVSQESRGKFVEKFNFLLEQSENTTDDEAILKLCDDELENLNEKLRLYTPILNMIKEYKSLKEDEKFLEASSKDSSRLLSRNSHKILLKEENIRKRLSRYLPSLLKNLKAKLLEAEGVLDNPIQLDGEDLLTVISREEEQLSLRYPRSRLTAMGATQNKSRSDRGGGLGGRSTTRRKNFENKVVKPTTSRATTRLAFEVTTRQNGIKYHSVQNTPHRKVGTGDSTRMSSQINISRQALSLPRPLKRPIISSPISQSARSMNRSTRLVPPTDISRNLYRSLHTTETAGTVTTDHLHTGTSGETSRKQRIFGLLDSRDNRENSLGQTTASRTLSPLNLNRLNKPSGFIHLDRGRSKIPSLIAPSNIFTKKIGEEEKENAKPLVATDKLTEGNNGVSPVNENKSEIPKGKGFEISQPDTKVSIKSIRTMPVSVRTMAHEPDRSIYRLMVSPDGKFRLGIEQRGLPEDSFDDTSILEE